SINDGESQEVFWVNLPAIQSFLNSVQLQRGVGTSVNGPAAFGASINMQTAVSQADPYGLAEFSAGSYNTFITTAGAGTGLLKNGFSLDVRYSHSSTDGYIRNAKADLNSLFVSGGWRNAKNSLIFNYIYGSQQTGITWEGILLEQYEKDRRYNLSGQYFDDAGNVHYYDNEIDSYRQHYAQALYTREFKHNLSWSTIFNFTKGDGYYENYIYDKKYSKYGLDNQIVDGVEHKKGDFIIRQAMDNGYWAFSSNLSYNAGALRTSLGASFSFYDGDHFGNMLWAKYNANIPQNYSWYLNTGKKTELSTFLRGEWDLCRTLTLFADLQYRSIDFNLSGADKDFVSMTRQNHYSFFNPKAGITVTIDNRNTLFASVAVGHREPSRSDVKESIKAGKADLLKAEELVDYEIGYKYVAPKFNLWANLYFMEYKNQLVSTGKLSETGYVIKENIPQSYRRGIELSAVWQVADEVQVAANVTLSANKLKNYTCWVDTYDDDYNWSPVEQTKVFYKSSHLTLSPGVIGMARVTAEPFKNVSKYLETTSLSLSGKYVGEQYMDNSSSAAARVPEYFTMALNASHKFKVKDNSHIELSLCVDNLLNNKYYSYGWIYTAKFLNGADDYVEQGIYPQAERNFMIRVAYAF
ncbi:MAG: TonB-dependent receptor, partial [Bacteroidales bacterium]|nr:TonB-dependent receptor [Bacteroidales bacterium]